MNDLDKIKKWLENNFSGVEIFKYEGDDCVRFTNGSGGHYINIKPQGETLKLTGEIYWEEVDTSCDFNKDDLIEKIRKIS